MPLQRGHLGPSSDVAPSLDHAPIAERNADPGIRANQAISTERYAYATVAGRCSRQGRAAANMASGINGHTAARVYAKEPLVLRIGERNEALADLHAAHRVFSSAFVTGWYPFGQSTPAEENAERQRRLLSGLQELGFEFIAGLGKHPSGDWPGEESFLGLGLELETGAALGTHFEQNAIVWSGADAVPRPVLLR